MCVTYNVTPSDGPGRQDQWLGARSHRNQSNVASSHELFCTTVRVSGWYTLTLPTHTLSHAHTHTHTHSAFLSRVRARVTNFQRDHSQVTKLVIFLWSLLLWVWLVISTIAQKTKYVNFLLL